MPITKTLADRLKPWQQMLLTALACTLTALLATPLIGHLDLANIVMLFLLTVLLAAVLFGRDAAVLAAFFSVALFDFFFVPPRFSLTVSDAQYLVTFTVMLAAALITGQLAAGLRRQAQAAEVREAQTRALYGMATELAGALTLAQVAEITRRFLRDSLQADGLLLLPDAAGQLQAQNDGPAPFATESHLAHMAYAGDFTACGELADNGYASAYLPLSAPTRIRGVVAVAPVAGRPEALAGQRHLLETMASLVAIAVERIHYVEVAQSTQVEMASERLRSSVLSALSHDMRTPLTALVGMADSLAQQRPPLPPPAVEAATAIREQANRLCSLVGNLLDMARLHAGKVTLRKEWQPVEEVLGSSIKLLGGALAGHPVRATVAPDLPLVEFDAVLIERVLCNLLENAAKYAPAGTPIDLSAALVPGALEVAVRDRGPGFAPGSEVSAFTMFVRGEAETSKPGVGLGLAICRAIVEAHGGTIAAANATDGGARVAFTLPTGTPPVIEAEPLAEEQP